jgi:cysteine synthase A
LYAVGVEPAGSPFVSEGKKGPHKIQGIGAGFKPAILDLDVVDEIMTIEDEEAYYFARLLAKKEGCFVGISNGANLAAAVKLAKKYPDKNIVTVLPDNGERYLSVEGLYE